MKRLLYNDLVEWKKTVVRKPLILRGARQVGKSWLLSEFGRHEFPAFHLFDFEKDSDRLLPLFEESLEPGKLLQGLALVQNRPIHQDDLIVFDEIQACPRALTSLKYFCEELPEQPVCAAGSLLGVAIAGGSFPVGKVTFLDLYPLDFEEFLMNSGQDLLFEAFVSSWNARKVSGIAHTGLWSLLKEFYIVGGMPEAVQTYFGHGDRKAEGFFAVRKLQSALIGSFLQDFTKHSGAVNAAHIAAVFENIPRQLSGYMDASVKRYRFKDVVPGRKGYGQLEGPIGWLEKAGLVHRVSVCERAEVPFNAFCKNNMFKLFVLDGGLLGCMLGLSPDSLMAQDYGLTKGFFAENHVAAEFVAAGESHLYSWSERNSEIEFLMDWGGEVVPVEVKSGLRTKAQSLRRFILKYNPRHVIKISAKPLEVSNETLINVPLYYAGRLARGGRDFLEGSGT
ncbi:hypothetical protein PDESU_03476 [Pontiella desulfatans]|uniref:AAA+ ATPase domain-containing protein n=1 Tax=Pontiella desulfatans TaxID=2750659 RepID=A0A6C2U688_PONDE|nr:AAA family ATPase [Pontiella desulfatans]VGO14906.1 hypothetical protein PDESU_03476 [Pontiella desulfatans]